MHYRTLSLLLKNRRRNVLAVILSLLGILNGVALDLPTVGGVIRARYEYMTLDELNRFAIRNARVWIRGSLIPVIGKTKEIKKIYKQLKD